MTKIKAFLAMGLLLIIGACGQQPPSKFVEYNGPEVTSLMVFKEKRVMHLLNGNRIIHTVPMQLGFSPDGHKQAEGDGRTPEGTYRINRRNPNSAYHLSLGISYPNTTDVEVARELGVSPGGDIFIHGTPNMFSAGGDWTAGCIAVTNEEMEMIYAAVADGTPIFIYP
jgi:murein L,D-transpeptidase YafK